MPRSTILVAFALPIFASAAAVGCAAPVDDASRFKEAVPQTEDVKLNVPGAQVASGSKTQSISTTIGIRTLPGATTPTGADSTARYYRFTRDITGAVDWGTAVILGGIWAIVNTTPTSVDAKTAVWGPGQGNALEPVIWKFTVSEVGTNEYDYALEGQPKAGGAWTAVLTGHGYGNAHPLHKTGWFKADNDAYKTLDPARGKDQGTTKVTYDLRQIPATIAVELRPGDAVGWADVKVTHEAAGAGEVDIVGLGDIDDSKATKLEDVHVTSRWTTAGSGRADIELKNGDLPFTVTATECWSDAFARVYYEDTVNYEPASGNESACAVK